MADLTGDARRLARQSDDRLLDEDSEREERRKTFAKSRKQTLPVKDIEVPNDYRPLDYEKFKKLLPDFETNGIKDRIEVHARGSRYILLHGRLRLEAAKRLRLDEIRAVVFSDYRPKAEQRKKAPSKPLPKEWVLVGRARAGDIEARNVLIEHYYRVATFVGAKGAKGLEFSATDGVAVDAIIAAIDTWNPSKGSLSTWVGTKAKYAVADLRRQERRQHAIKKSLYHGVRAGSYYGAKPQADDGLEKRQAHNKVTRHLQDLGLDDWLKRRKGVDSQDQQVARYLFVNGMLPSEVAKAIGWSTRSVERAKARIIKAVAGKTTSAKSTWWKSEWDRPPPCGYLRAEHFTYNGTVTRSKAARRVCSWWLRYNPDRQIDLGLRDELAADLAANRMPRRSVLRKFAEEARADLLRYGETPAKRTHHIRGSVCGYYSAHLICVILFIFNELQVMSGKASDNRMKAGRVSRHTQSMHPEKGETMRRKHAPAAARAFIQYKRDALGVREPHVTISGIGNGFAMIPLDHVDAAMDELAKIRGLVKL